MAATIRVIQFALTTSIETQDVTISGLGDCEGYALFWSTAVTNDAEAASMTHGMGVCDSLGTTESVMATSLNGEGTSQTSRYSGTDLMHHQIGDTVDAVVQHDSYITDGFRLDVTNAPATAILVEAWVFYGDDINTVATTLTTSGTNNAEVTVNVGQLSNAVLFGNINMSTAGSTNNARIGIGFAAGDGGTMTPTQGGLQAIDTDNQSTTSTFFCALNDRIGADLRHASDGTLITSYECTTIDSSNVGITNRENTGGGGVHFIVFSIYLGGTLRAHVGEFQVPTSGGNQAYTGTGFTPQFAGLLLSNISGYITSPGSGTESTTGYSFYTGAADSTAGYCVGAHSQTGVTTTNTGSYTDNTLVATRDFTGGVESVGTLASFDSDGLTVNYTANPATAWDGIFLAIEAEEVVATVQDLVTRSGKRRKNETIRRRISRSLRRLAHIWSILPMIPPPVEPPGAPMTGGMSPMTGNLPSFARRRMRARRSYKDLLEERRLQEKATRKSMDKNIDKGMK